jgi:hypothetical protein
MRASQKRKALHRELLKRLDMAGYQTSRIDIVRAIKSTWLQGLFGVTSSKEMDDAQLDVALLEVLILTLSVPTDSSVRKMSMEQRRCIIRLGKYVLGPKYGDGWFWRKLPEWTVDFNTQTGTPSGDGRIRKVTRLDDLTMAEAVYIIRVMEQIEFRLKSGGM